MSSSFRAFECKTKEELQRLLKQKMEQAKSRSTPVREVFKKTALNQAASNIGVIRKHSILGGRTPLGNVSNRQIDNTPVIPSCEKQATVLPLTPRKPIVSKYAALLRTPESETEDTSPTVNCKICGVGFPLNKKDFQTAPKFRKHAVYHAPINTMSCLLCDDMQCRREEVMKEHLRTVHEKYMTIKNKKTLMKYDVPLEDEHLVVEFLDKCFPDVPKKEVSNTVRRRKNKKNTQNEGSEN